MRRESFQADDSDRHLAHLIDATIVSVAAAAINNVSLRHKHFRNRPFTYIFSVFLFLASRYPDPANEHLSTEERERLS